MNAIKRADVSNFIADQASAGEASHGLSGLASRIAGKLRGDHRITAALQVTIAGAFPTAAWEW